MGAMTILELDDDVQLELRVYAAANGRSPEDEARAIIQDELARRKWLNDGERSLFKPEQQAALARLREAYSDPSGASVHARVDDFLKTRSAGWAEE